MLKTIRKIVFIVMAGILLGYLLMTAVYAMPLEWVGKPYEATIETLRASGIYPHDPFSQRRIDNYADSVSMLLASYPGDESPWRKSAVNYFLSYDGKDLYYTAVNPYAFLSGQYDPAGANISVATYSRYWHGNLLLFKPLMRYFSYSQIRRINFSLVLLLTGIASALLLRRLQRFLLPFLLMIMIIAPTTIGRTIEYSCVIMVMLLEVIILLWVRPFSLPGSQNVRYLFLCAGIATAFVDFLTAPTITLTVPLVLLCQLRHREKGMLRLILECIVFWGCGYAGMWGGKWVIALIADGPHIFNMLKEAVILRVSTTERFTRQHAIIANIQSVFSTWYINFAFVLLAILELVQNYRHRKELSPGVYRWNLLFLIPILIMVLWYIGLPEHSCRHYFFTYRTAAGIVPALLATLDLRNRPAWRHTAADSPVLSAGTIV